MSLPLLLRILFLLFFFLSMCKSNQIRNIKAVINGDFRDKKITETPAKTRLVRSKAGCVVECKKSPSCLSFSFYDYSKVCYLYDKDFINVTGTLTTDEVGWSYYYVVTGNNPERTCELPTFGICQSFCFFYKNGFLTNTVQEFMQACADDGGKVIKVDRTLKQYCMAQAVEQIIGDDSMALNGVQNELTGEWRYFDGTEITFFNWDVDILQPDYVSPIATPGLYEGYLATMLKYKYRWHDAPDSWITSVMCEIN